MRNKGKSNDCIEGSRSARTKLIWRDTKFSAVTGPKLGFQSLNENIPQDFKEMHCKCEIKINCRSHLTLFHDPQCPVLTEHSRKVTLRLNETQLINAHAEAAGHTHTQGDITVRLAHTPQSSTSPVTTFEEILHDAMEVYTDLAFCV